MAMLGFGDSNDGEIFETLKVMWAENGDVISKMYAGTSSTITSVTKTGKQGFMGKLD
jgi:phosphatidylinositol-bisphosphatase